MNSPLAPKGDDSPISLVVGLFLDLGAEGNGAHNAVAKLLVQNGLIGVTVVLDDLEKSVDQGILGGHLQGPPTVGVT